MDHDEYRAEEARINAMSAWAYGRELRGQLIEQGLTEFACRRCSARIMADALRAPAGHRGRYRRAVVRLVSGLGLRREHPQTHWEDRDVCVDSDILPFLDFVNAEVATTTLSCQGDPYPGDELTPRRRMPWVATTVFGGAALANWLLDECGIFVRTGDRIDAVTRDDRRDRCAVIEVIPATPDHEDSAVFRFPGLTAYDLTRAADRAIQLRTDGDAERIRAVADRAAIDRQNNEE